MANNSIIDAPDTECTCKACVDMCKHRVCWGTPQEIQAIIDNGRGKFLMLDYWCDEPNIDILCPGIRGYEGKDAPYRPYGVCTFLSSKDECLIHTEKPIEGRKSQACTKVGDTHWHHEVAMMWDTPEAKELITNWKEAYYNV